jgi:16S rRNA (cytosine1402-N4)-methyltransferase
MINGFHEPVLVEEVLRFLITEPSGIYVDGTLGGGGHAASILKQLSVIGKLIGFDEDKEAIDAASKKLLQYQDRVYFRRENFSNIKSGIRQLGFEKVNGVFFDLGVSSHQIDAGERGFSFQVNGPLDMRMNKMQKISARDIVNSYSKEQLNKVFKEYGEEKFAANISDKIVRARETKTIETTIELTSIIEQCVSPQFIKKSFARIFQAIRIEVNNELENLKIGLQNAIEILIPGGRIIILSYHSLEDRIVKEIFRKESQTVVPSGHKLVPDTLLNPRVKVLVKKPIEASNEETESNPRARSVKLRVAERL